MTQHQLYEPREERMKASDVRNNWGEILIDVERGDLRVVMERRGRQTVVLISAEELERYQRLIATLSPEQREKFLQIETEREEQQRILKEQHITLEGQRRALDEQRRALKEQKRIIQALEKRLKELRDPSVVRERTNVLTSEVEHIEQSLRRMRRELKLLKQYSNGSNGASDKSEGA